MIKTVINVVLTVVYAQEKGHTKLINVLFFIFVFFLFTVFLSRHQGFGVLSVILANHAIKLLTSLFQDLQVEALHRVSEKTNKCDDLRLCLYITLK